MVVPSVAGTATGQCSAAEAWVDGVVPNIGVVPIAGVDSWGFVWLPTIVIAWRLLKRNSSFWR